MCKYYMGAVMHVMSICLSVQYGHLCQLFLTSGSLVLPGVIFISIPFIKILYNLYPVDGLWLDGNLEKWLIILIV